MKFNLCILLFAAGLAGQTMAQNGPPQNGMGGGMGGMNGGMGGGMNGGMGGQGGQRHGPPLEAIAACQGKASGAVCSFTGRQNEKLTGTCFTPPAGGAGQQLGQQPGQQQGQSANAGQRPMACRPDHGPRPNGQGGPAGQAH